MNLLNSCTKNVFSQSFFKFEPGCDGGTSDGKIASAEDLRIQLLQGGLLPPAQLGI